MIDKKGITTKKISPEVLTFIQKFEHQNDFSKELDLEKIEEETEDLKELWRKRKKATALGKPKKENSYFQFGYDYSG